MNFTPESRRSILAEYFALQREIVQSSYAQSASPTAARADYLDVCQQRLSQLWKTYEAGLPDVALSRCPFTGATLTLPFDSMGLDGLWWRYEAPIRGYPGPFRSLMALTGAVHLDRSVEDAPFLVVPGPGLPFVYPRMLKQGTIKGVVYCLSVGRHKAFAVVYFAPSRPLGLVMPNLWATNNYEFTRPDGSTGWYETFDSAKDWDFQLGPWISSGKLLWIAPGDPTMTLQSGLENCPYLDLPGERREQRIYQGNVEVGRPGVSPEEPAPNPSPEVSALAQGMKRLAQQFDRQIAARAKALKEQGVEANLPQDLLDDISSLKKLQSHAWSPAQVSAELARRGRTLEQVANLVATTLSAIKKLKPR